MAENKKNPASKNSKQNANRNTNTKTKNKNQPTQQKSKPMTAAKAASHSAATNAEKAPRTNKKSTRRPNQNNKPKKPALPIRYTVLGGLNEIGKNMAVLEYGDDAIIIDCGMSFPDEDLLGVDVVLPDFAYALKIKEKIRGIFITHGHEDHIGALPYLLKQMDIPVRRTTDCGSNRL